MKEDNMKNIITKREKEIFQLLIENKSTKEISNILVSNLSEGLLDELEDTLSTGDSLMDEKLLESWAVTKDYKIKKTKQGYKLVGSFVIKDIKESLYNGPLIKEVKGNLSIENTKLINLHYSLIDLVQFQ